MERSERAHRTPDDVSALDSQRVEDAADIVTPALLRIALPVLRHVRRRVATRVVSDAAVAAGKVPYLRLPAAMIAREFVHEHHRGAAAGLLLEQRDVVVGLERWHMAF